MCMSDSISFPSPRTWPIPLVVVGMAYDGLHAQIEEAMLDVAEQDYFPEGFAGVEAFHAAPPVPGGGVAGAVVAASAMVAAPLVGAVGHLLAGAAPVAACAAPAVAAATVAPAAAAAAPSAVVTATAAVAGAVAARVGGALVTQAVKCVVQKAPILISPFQITMGKLEWSLPKLLFKKHSCYR